MTLCWVPASTTKVFPLTPEEAAYFGWSTPGQAIPLVLGCLSPEGAQVIPTREQLPNGEYFYGFIETYERGGEVDLDPWELPSDDLVLGGVM